MMKSIFSLRAPALSVSIAILAVILSTVLISTVYLTYSQTWDEAAHIACGMEWLERGTYSFEALHPPLARVATAVPLFIAGRHLQPQSPAGASWDDQEMLVQGNALLHAGGRYKQNLTLSRLGILPFFWITCVFIYRFMASRFGDWYGAASVSLFALCPPVLAHASLATTDVPLMALYTWSLICLLSFLERPTTLNAVLVGVSFALACLTKFTAILFYAPVAFLMLGVFWLRLKRFPVPWRPLLLAIVLVPLIIWAGYRFSIGPVYPPGTYTASKAKLLESASPRQREMLTQTSVPAHEFFRGLISVARNGATGRYSYLLGQTYTGGRLIFFPVALLVKTPITMLLFFFAGLYFVIRQGLARAQSACLLILLGTLSPLLIGMGGQMNIGLRHILPVFPFVSMLAGIGAVELWRVRPNGRLGPSLVVLLIGFDLVSCLRAAPDFLPYFNEASSYHADYLLANSDLDWGQDLLRLQSKLKHENAEAVSISYFGDPHTDLSGLPPHDFSNDDRHPTGWIAVSESNYLMYHGNFSWLDSYPYTLVGRSIRLYHLKNSSLPNGAGS